MFILDKQTLKDLNVTNSRHADMVDFFDRTVTLGGRDILYTYFLEPLTSRPEIEDRQWVISCMKEKQIDHILDKYMMQDLESYLAMPLDLRVPTKTSYYLELISSSFTNSDFKKREILIKRSVQEIAKIIIYIKQFLELQCAQNPEIKTFARYYCHIEALLEDIALIELERLAQDKPPIDVILKYDYVFRNLKRVGIRDLFTILYHLDALSGIAKCLTSKLLVFPRIKDRNAQPAMLVINGGYNLFLQEPIKNNIEIIQGKNIWYLTGANMTGKSTLLKTVGTCVYLAHLGFPVPADHMDTVLFDGIMATINLGDNISTGASHFFNEVLRVKQLAELLVEDRNMFVLIDELFKGTNHNDASEATLELIHCLQSFNQSVFLISSHITEISGKLRKDTVQLKYLETRLGHRGIDFTYLLSEGVAEEKLGMWLLKREEVFRTLQKRKTS